MILNRSDESLNGFFTKHSRRELSEAEQTIVLELLEMQRHAMLMYTSCGWFFDELSGIETVQVIFYAGRTVQLAEKLFGVEVEKPFKETAVEGEIQHPSWQDGGKIYEQIVKPVVVDLRKVAAHFAISSFISDYGDTVDDLQLSTCRRRTSREGRRGEAKAEVGRITVTSLITLDSATFVIHGDTFRRACVQCRRSQLSEDRQVYEPMKQEFLEIFEKGDIAELIRFMDRSSAWELYAAQSVQG